MKKGLIIGIIIGLTIGLVLGVVITYVFIKSTLSETKDGTMVVSIKSSMSSVVPAGIICEDENGKVLSGKGGDEICSNKVGNWPNISFCGPNPGDTNWVVLDGDSENWNFTLECKDFTNCNGPQNAICDKNGCEFLENCK